MDLLSTTVLPDDIEEVLKLIPSRSLQSRVRNEVKLLYNDYSDVIVKQDKKDTNISVKFTEHIDSKKIRRYEFILPPTHYPFRPPAILVNDIPYSTMLTLSGDFEKKKLQQIRGQDCLCCHSVNCNANWSPAIKIHHILNEIKKTIQFKRDVIYLLLAEKIKKKHNVPFLDIESYLV
jgi:ubiquitin-protein ligase